MSEQLLSDADVFGSNRKVDLSPLERAFDRVAGDIESENAKVVADAVKSFAKTAKDIQAANAKAVSECMAALDQLASGMEESSAKAVREIIMEAVGRIKVPDMGALGAEVAKAIGAVAESNRQLAAQVVASNEKMADAMASLAAAEGREIKVEMASSKAEKQGNWRFEIERDPTTGDMSGITARPDTREPDAQNAMEAAKRAVRAR